MQSRKSIPKVCDSYIELLLLTIQIVDSQVKKQLLAYLPSAPAPAAEASMEIDSGAPPQSPVTQEPLPETEVYIRLLIIYHFLAKPETRSKTFDVAHETINKIQHWNRRSMDPLAAKVWFAVGRAYEIAGELADLRP